MSSYLSSECRRVSPSVHGNRFDTAHRKKAAGNIFENVNQDALRRLFQKTGDMKAEERVRSIFSFSQDPEETARALMALKQRKKDKFLQILGMVRQLLNQCRALDQRLYSPTLFLPFISRRNGECFDVNRHCGRQPLRLEDSNHSERKIQGGVHECMKTKGRGAEKL
ncbi:hypothetical protein Q5P01_014940 [Channa striata]|uniref:Arginine vasopressin-induced protein 1/transcriptional and immune response regulator domain-containing protein n=1 Tax=Channa striata TaxID=64152 RepID=A0AA88SLI8_CHASR|nr:hypothetical protein Q5P01_014940 [Channa striata]